MSATRQDRSEETSPIRDARCEMRAQALPPSAALTYHGSVAGQTHNGPRLWQKQSTHDGGRSNAAGG